MQDLGSGVDILGEDLGAERECGAGVNPFNCDIVIGGGDCIAGEQGMVTALEGCGF